MNIKITADYTGEPGEILVCSHESTGGTLSIMAGDLHLRVTAEQAKILINSLTIGLNIIQEYEKMMKKIGTGGNGT